MKLSFPIVHIVNQTPEKFGRNAKNNIFEIWICKRLGRGQSWLGVLAQEIFEVRYKWRRLFLPMIFRRWKEEMELLSHAVEAQVAYEYDGYNLKQYLQTEAEALVAPGSSYRQKGLFPGKSVQDMLAQLEARMDDARAWVDDHLDMLNGWALDELTLAR